MKFIIHALLSFALLTPLVYAQTATPKVGSLSKLDANKNQKVSKDEALKAGMPEVVFKEIDIDNSGEITVTEFVAYKAKNKSIAAIDTNNDTKISKAEALKAGMTENEFRILDKDNSGYITQAEWDSGDWIIW